MRVAGMEGGAGRGTIWSYGRAGWIGNEMISPVCRSIPSGGCVVGRCWEACPSWVSVSLIGLSSWLAG